MFAQSVWAESIMPIIAYYGPLIESMSRDEYQVMKDCGFTHTLNIYNSLENAQADMERASQVGVKVFVHSPQVLQNPSSAVTKLSKQSAFAGYFLADEPVTGEASNYAKIVEAIQELDSTHPCYINLNPFYGESQLEILGASSYEGYLQAMSTIGLPQISFDFYPVTNNGLRDTWFYTLNAIREESLRTGKPLWAYALCVPHGDYPQPTLAMLRLQVYVNLVYGAQAIQYFTYKTPYDNSQYDFHHAPIDANGEKTATYSLVKQMNEELKPVVSLFYGAKIESVGHLINIPLGCKEPTLPSEIKSLNVVGSVGAVVSVFSNNGHKYLAVVNKDYKSHLTLKLSLNSAAVRSISKQLIESAPKAVSVVLPGDIALFKLN